MRHPFPRLALALALCAPGVAAADTDPFPAPPELAEAVSFWTNVYSAWGVGQVAVHDMEHLGLIYEVVDLPGTAGETYTEVQRAFVRERVRDWQHRLLALEHRVASGVELSFEEKELALKITESAGSDALAGAAARVRSQKGVRERFRRGLEIAGRYDTAFREIFREAGLPEDLAYLPHVESSFQAHARSSAGAVGVWQFTRGAGRIFLTINSAMDERLDPVASARGAARYFRKAYDLLGSWPLAVTSYNHGIAGMVRARAALGDDLPRIVREYDGKAFGFASRNFYAEFLAARAIASAPESFFPEGIALEPPLSLRQVRLDRPSRVNDVARKLGVPARDLRRANPAWTASAARGTALLPAGTRVWVPERTAVAQAGPDPAPEPQAPAAPVARHRVRAGDTLWTVARTYGMNVSELRRLNGLSPKAQTIRPGQMLKVSAPAQTASAQPRAHVVQPGETLLAIAARYGVTLADLVLANQIADPGSLKPGQRLVLPH